MDINNQIIFEKNTFQKALKQPSNPGGLFRLMSDVRGLKSMGATNTENGLEVLGVKGWEYASCSELKTGEAFKINGKVYVLTDEPVNNKERWHLLAIPYSELPARVIEVENLFYGTSDSVSNKLDSDLSFVINLTGGELFSFADNTAVIVIEKKGGGLHPATPRLAMNDLIAFCKKHKGVYEDFYKNSKKKGKSAYIECFWVKNDVQIGEVS